MAPRVKLIICITLILSVINPLYAQEDALIHALGKRAVTIDSLNRVVKSYSQSAYENQVKLQNVQDTISILKSDLSKLENFKVEKNNIDMQIKVKNDSITLLKSILAEKDKELKTQEQTNKQKIKDASEKSRSEIVMPMVNYYKNTPFDDLIQSSTQQSVQNDKVIIGNNMEVESILSNLDKYFSKKRQLEIKFDAAEINNGANQLSQIKIESPSLNKLKNTLQNYQAVNEGLKETIVKIIVLDGRESVANGPKEIQNQKFNKIMADISYFIFNYDFNFLNYPYLADVVLEVIKRKAPNPDADISNLLQKL